MSNELSPIGSFKKIMQQYNQYSPKWSGIFGTDHIASIGECERLLIDSNCFIYNGLERFLFYFNANKISSLNLNGMIID